MTLKKRTKQLLQVSKKRKAKIESNVKKAPAFLKETVPENRKRVSQLLKDTKKFIGRKEQVSRFAGVTPHPGFAKKKMGFPR